jgi:hypothetical protein
MYIDIAASTVGERAARVLKALQVIIKASVYIYISICIFRLILHRYIIFISVIIIPTVLQARKDRESERTTHAWNGWTSPIPTPSEIGMYNYVCI